MNLKIFYIVILLINLLSGCKKQEMTGDLNVLVGEWKCVQRYLGGSSGYENVAGTKYEHTLFIYENGKYKMDFAQEKTCRGRIKSARKTDNVTYLLQFAPNIFAHNYIISSGEYYIRYYSSTNIIRIQMNSGPDYDYIKIN